MHFEGNFEVLRRLFVKQYLMAQGDSRHEKIRPALAILSGGIRGVYGGGQVTALEQFNLADSFDVVEGVSAGACNALYFLAGKARVGTTLYYEECMTRKFISHRRLFRREGIMDIDYLCRVFRGEESVKAVDLSAFRKSRANFVVGVTRHSDGKYVLVNIKQEHLDPIEVVRASMTVPGFSIGHAVLEGVQYLDGASQLLPLTLLQPPYNCTDLLLLAHGTRRGFEELGLQERIARHLITMRLPHPTRRAFIDRRHGVKKALEDLLAQRRCRFAVLWCDEEVGVFERDKRKVRQAATRAEEHLSRLLESARAAALRDPTP